MTDKTDPTPRHSEDKHRKATLTNEREIKELRLMREWAVQNGLEDYIKKDGFFNWFLG